MRSRALVALAATLAACVITEPAALPKSEAKIVSTPTELLFTTTDTIRQLRIFTVPLRQEGAWAIAGIPQWMSVSPTEGTFAGENVSVTVKAIPHDTLDAGEWHAVLELSGHSVQAAQVFLELQHITSPKATFSSTEVAFGASGTRDSVLLSNTGKGNLRFDFATTPSWLTVAPDTGTLRTGQQRYITLQASRQGQPTATVQSATVAMFNRLDGTQFGALAVTMVVPGVPFLKVVDTPLVYNDELKTRLMGIRNDGNGDLAWSVHESDGVTVSPSSGVLAPGQLGMVTVTSSGAAGSTGKLVFATNAPKTRDTILARVNAGGLPAGGEVLLTEGGGTSTFHEAEYNAATRRVVYLHHFVLRVMNATTGSLIRITGVSGRNLAVRPDGNMAAVHLDSDTIKVRPLDGSTAGSSDWVRPGKRSVTDLLYSSPDWVHVTHNCELESRNIQTGATVDGTSAACPLLARVNGDHFYATDGKSFMRYDLSAGAPVLQRSVADTSPLSFWLAEGGTRIVTKDGVIRRATSDPTTDMQRLGRLVTGEIEALADLPSKSSYYLVLRGLGGDAIHVVRSSDFAVTQIIRLPQVKTFNGPAIPETRFLFADPVTNRIIAFAEAGGRLFLIVLQAP